MHMVLKVIFIFLFQPKAYDPRGPMSHVGGGPDFTPDYVKSAMGNKVCMLERSELIPVVFL